MGYEIFRMTRFVQKRYSDGGTWNILGVLSHCQYIGLLTVNAPLENTIILRRGPYWQYHIVYIISNTRSHLDLRNNC